MHAAAGVPHAVAPLPHLLIRSHVVVLRQKLHDVIERHSRSDVPEEKGRLIRAAVAAAEDQRGNGQDGSDTSHGAKLARALDERIMGSQYRDMSRLGVMLLIVGTAVAVAVTGVIWRARRTHAPLYSLQQLADAFRSRDRVAVDRYLDIRRVAESVVDEAVSATVTTDGPGALGQALELRPTLVSVFEQSILMGLEDTRTAAADAGQSVVGIGMDYRTLAEVYQGITEVQERDAVAKVGVRIRLSQLDSAVVVHLRMERADGYWRVIGVEDLAGPMTAARQRRMRARTKPR